MRAANTPDQRPVVVIDFEHSYGFSFDPFQSQACAAVAQGSSVLVAAPTGAGKTVVGEFAAWMALRGGGKTFYTTPIKALSNQKYGDFVELHGAENVGLLTGDNSVNGDAPIVVMTTEVLRNMIYEDAPVLADLRYVVLDEVHYLQDRYRGGVWEEVLIHLPVDVLTVSLSATVSNAEEFAEWLKTLRGSTEVIIEEKRPVEIRHWYFASDELLPMFVKKSNGEVIPNPQGRQLGRRKSRGAERPRRGGQRPRARGRPPRRTEVIDRLSSESMLPVIYFIFSRKGCDDAVMQCLRDNVRLTTASERKEIVTYASERVGDLSPEELEVLGYDSWVEALRRGVAAHHAGMIPAFKEIVEELFSRGLVKAVFATETLALGINMPARTVVVESLMKFTGEKHEQITPGQYTQLSGRAGRRGIDELGHCVVLMQRFIEFDAITRLASTRTYPLVSSFRPSYNMAVNLVRNYDRPEAEHLVNSSFAQYQADRDVVQLEQSKERLEAYLASYRERFRCDLGDFDEYRKLHDKLRRLEGRHGSRQERERRERTLDAINSLEPGDVIQVRGGRRRGRYAVLDVTQRRSEKSPRVLALSEERSMVRFAPVDFREPPRPVGRLRLPKGFHTRDAHARRKVARDLADLKPGPPARVEGLRAESSEMEELASRLERHPCSECPDLSRHIHFAERATRLEKEVQGIARRIGRRTQTLARRFERVLEVLEHLGYVERWTLTNKGEILSRVYNESDLLVVEAIEEGLFEDLNAPDLAAVISALVFETRGPDPEVTASMPSRASDGVWKELMALWRSIHRDEEVRGLELTREPDPGFAARARLWASGEPLDEVLGYEDAAGDFVRSVKQLVDLLRQLVEIAPTDELAARLKDATESVHRGVVAYTSLELDSLELDDEEP
ncbi:MAG: DEAD/DEAH box helicase [Actinomycetota bacterium]|nr:DEAD/DEAH box helicase [Actinomycetota bacterium]